MTSKPKTFVQFKQETNSSDFNDISFLQEKSRVLESTNPELSRRISIRIKNLEKRALKDKTEKAHIFEPLIKLINGKYYILTIIVPLFIFSFYLLFLATPRYESRTKVIIQQPDSMATMDAGMALLTGLGVSNTSIDSHLVSEFIYSNDMLEYLDEELSLRKHYEDDTVDFFSRLHSWNSIEEFSDYFSSRVNVELDEKSSIITISSQAFDPSYAQKLSQLISERAEQYINNIGHQLAESQLKFIEGEHKNTEVRLQNAKKNILQFQRKNKLLDPKSDGMALSQITYSLENEIAKQQAKLIAYEKTMSGNAPTIVQAKNIIKGLQEQLDIERKRLTSSVPTKDNTEFNPINEVASEYSQLEIELELALKTYTASLVSLEKSRVEAYRQLKYLITIESVTTPEDSTYPETTYNIALLAILLFLAHGIVRIIISTIKEI